MDWENLRLDRNVINDVLRNNKTVASATAASLISTVAGYPLDSLKSRLQASKASVTAPMMAARVWKEEGIGGFFRGLWIPLFTISAVRVASFTIYTESKAGLHRNGLFAGDSLRDVACSGWLGGAVSGAVICFGSAPFELVKVRRQLEYSIAEKKGLTVVKPPTTTQAVMDIVRTSGIRGLYTGFGLHFLRDTSGTALYFFEYDSFRHLLGRDAVTGRQMEPPAWMPLHPGVIPFVCGSLAAVTSWALIYPLDVVKTKVQQRALAGERARGPWETFVRLARGPERDKTFLVGVARLYRGLGVSALRSVATHGVLWTLIDRFGGYIDGLPMRVPA